MLVQNEMGGYLQQDTHPFFMISYKGAIKNSEYQLTDVEQRLARYLANQRYLHNRRTNTFNNKIGPQSNEETDLEGIAAEIAFCRLFNIYPDIQLTERPDYDAILPDGLTVDVKSTTHPNGRLLAVIGKVHKPPHLYALMTGEFSRGYVFRGFYPSSKLFQDNNIKNLGYGPTYAVEQSRLKDLYGN